jgi:hypothetical protein
VARIRTIKPEFFTSEQIAECSTSARLLFVGLWCFCDDGGVHPRSTKRIKMEIFPGDDVSDEQVASWVEELLRVGLLKSFDAKNERFLWVTGWRHQKIDRPTLRFPQPSEETKFDEPSPNARGSFDEPSPPEGNGRESKGSINTSSSAVADGARPPTLDRQFASWWQLVPRKVGKAAALKAYAKAVKKIQGRSPDDGPGGDDPHAFLADRISKFADSPSGRAAGSFCPHPSKWLADGRYDDDPSDWGGEGGGGSRVATEADLEAFDLVSGAAR